MLSAILIDDRTPHKLPPKWQRPPQLRHVTFTLTT